MRYTMREMIVDLRSPDSQDLLGKADINANRNPITKQFGEIHENFGNGLLRVYQGLDRDL